MKRQYSLLSLITRRYKICRSRKRGKSDGVDTPDVIKNPGKCHFSSADPRVAFSLLIQGRGFSYIASVGGGNECWIFLMAHLLIWKWVNFSFSLALLLGEYGQCRIWLSKHGLKYKRRYILSTNVTPPAFNMKNDVIKAEKWV